MASVDMIKRIDSMNLTQNVVLRNVIEKTSSPKHSPIPEAEEDILVSGGGEEDAGSILQHATDSLKYTKEKGISRQGSAKMRDKKKKKNNKNANDLGEDIYYDDIFELTGESGDLGSNGGVGDSLRPRDSLALPRRKSRKKEVRETADRLRHSDEFVARSIQATLGDSPLTDSMYVHRRKKKNKIRSGKGSSQLFKVGADDEDDDDSVSGSEESDNSDLDRSENVTITEEVSPPKTIDSSVIKDSIQVNMDRLAEKHKDEKNHHTQQQQKDPILENGEETIKENDDTEKETENANEETSNKINLKNNNNINKKQRAGNKNNTASKNIPQTTEEDTEEHFLCGECGFEFPTRNKLFSHIKTEGHAMSKTNAQQLSNSKKGNKKNKRK